MNFHLSFDDCFISNFYLSPTSLKLFQTVLLQSLCGELIFTNINYFILGRDNQLFYLIIKSYIILWSNTYFSVVVVVVVIVFLHFSFNRKLSWFWVRYFQRISGFGIYYQLSHFYLWGASLSTVSLLFSKSPSHFRNKPKRSFQQFRQRKQHRMKTTEVRVLKGTGRNPLLKRAGTSYTDCILSD